ncbi:MAG: DnaJ domain-containing protein [Rubrobacter sp.]|nr:DnaJ domain-containing protein [Rubrobacter sp.]
MAETVNYYEVLGVSRRASQTDIRNAYRSLAKERHPDHPTGSTEAFALLQEAHAVLSDPDRRQKHNEALDLAHAADQLSGLEGLDWGSLEDELSAKRSERASSGPSLGERLRGRFGRKEDGDRERSSRRERDDGGRRRGRYVEREARWHEPHYFDPEPITWRSGAICFAATFLALLIVGQLGRWATGLDTPPVFAAWATVLRPFMFILYTLAGLLTSYFAFRAAGYAAILLIFIAVLVVGNRGGPDNMLQLCTLGIIVLLVVIYTGKRRDEAARAR